MQTLQYEFKNLHDFLTIGASFALRQLWYEVESEQESTGQEKLLEARPGSASI